MRLGEEVAKQKDRSRFSKDSDFSYASDSRTGGRMDTRYWKEFESMGDMENDKRSDSGSDRTSPHYRKDSSERRRRSKTRSRSRSHSHSRSHSRSHSSSSSSSSSSRSSSSSSRHHSDYRDRRSSSKTKRDAVYLRKSPSRVGSSYSNKRDEERNGSNWFPPSHPNYSGQGPDIPPSGPYIPPQYPSTVQGSYPANFQGQQNFGSNYHGYPGYESSGNYYPPNPANFPHTSQPPLNEYNIGGPANHPSATNWEMFPDTTQPPPVHLGGPGPATGPISGDSLQGIPDIKSEEAKKEAIEQELLQQKRTLAKQREDYVKRKFSLNRELNRLKDQKRELLKENSKENERILRENAKLQNEILQKLKSIDNVIEMLSNIIGDSARLPEVIKEIKSSEKSEKKKLDKRKRDKSEDRRSSESLEDEHRERERTRERERLRETEHEDRDEARQKDENRVYYDPGLHWCSECNVFPKTVSEYLDHLHTSEHKQNTKLKFEDLPWHAGQNMEEKAPLLSKDGPPKRIPIRGVQFLVPSTAWFCSMCKVWLGDMHCATKHVQSNQHSSNYNEFIMRNQHWEVDWLTERTRSYERNSEAKQQLSGPVPQQAPPPPAPLTIASLSDQLLAMIAANSKLQEPPPPPPPPPPPITKSTSSSEDDSPGRKGKKKKKKSKKNKKSKESKSPPKELDQIKLNYKAMAERKAREPLPVDDSFISEWMPKVEKREAVQIKPKTKSEMSETVRPQKRMRMASGGTPDSSEIHSDRITSPYDQEYNDHDEAVVFEMRPPAPVSSSSSYDKEQQLPPRSKKKEEEPSRHERHSKYEKSPKEKSKYEDRYSKYNKFDKYKQIDKEDKDSKYDDHKSKKDNKSYSNERDKHKKSPLSRLKEIKEKEAERKRGRGKFIGPDKNDDDDVHETSFEKRTSESAAKKKDGKKAVPNNLPKTKLPFIGRMPILKKKVEQKSEEKEEKKDIIEDSASKDSIPELALLQEPVMEVVPVDMMQSVEELPKSTLIISKRPRLAEPGIVKKEILFNKPANDNLTEQDMDLDDDSAVVQKEEEPAKDELHKDFKDALDLLFPEEKKTDNSEESEVKQEAEVKMEEQQAIVASAAPTSYMLPAGYDMSLYQTYYDHAYVQQWAQMGYDQTGQYASAYAYPPPTMEGVQQTAMEVVAQPTETTAVPEPKKKKNPLSQRMRRHLRKKKAKEAADKAIEGGEEVTNDLGDMEDDIGEDDGDEFEDEEQETENEGTIEEQKGEGYNKLGDMSDLALLGIDEDDAAAQGLY